MYMYMYNYIITVIVVLLSFLKPIDELCQFDLPVTIIIAFNLIGAYCYHPSCFIFCQLHKKCFLKPRHGGSNGMQLYTVNLARSEFCTYSA